MVRIDYQKMYSEMKIAIKKEPILKNIPELTKYSLRVPQHSVTKIFIRSSGNTKELIGKKNGKLG